MVDTTISSVVGTFSSEAALQDATSRLTLAGFDRAALSRPSSDQPAHAAAARIDAEPVTTDTDRQQARTLGSSMAGAVAGMAAAGVTIATGGAAAVAVLAAVGVGAAAAGTTSMIGRGQQETVAEDRMAAAPDGLLTLSVRVLSPETRSAAETAMRAAGATQVLGQPADQTVTPGGTTI